MLPKTKLPTKFTVLVPKTKLAFDIAESWPSMSPLAQRHLMSFVHATKLPDISAAAYKLIGAMHPWTGIKADTMRMQLATWIPRTH